MNGWTKWSTPTQVVIQIIRVGIHSSDFWSSTSVSINLWSVNLWIRVDMAKTLIGWILGQLMKAEKFSGFGCMVTLAIPNSGTFWTPNAYNRISRWTYKKYFRTRPTIAIDCTIHSREWISPAVCRSFINEYLRCGQANAENCDSYLLEKFYGFNIFILPMLNAG